MSAHRRRQQAIYKPRHQAVNGTTPCMYRDLHQPTLPESRKGSALRLGARRKFDKIMISESTLWHSHNTHIDRICAYPPAFLQPTALLHILQVTAATAQASAADILQWAHVPGGVAARHLLGSKAAMPALPLGRHSPWLAPHASGARAGSGILHRARVPSAACDHLGGKAAMHALAVAGGPHRRRRPHRLRRPPVGWRPGRSR